LCDDGIVPEILQDCKGVGSEKEGKTVAFTGYILPNKQKNMQGRNIFSAK
jgi:hypothetical protein